MDYVVLAYYSVHPLAAPLEEIARQKAFFASRDFRGRIYISEQGINGQASALKAHADEYIDWMKQDPRFAEIEFKLHPSNEHVFPKMTVKYRKQLVAIDQPVDFAKRGPHLSPEAWKQALAARDENTLVLDVRNDYEWAVGHFEGADLPPLETFRQFPEYARKLKEERDPQKTKVLMYCTGGIRCEFYSAVMKEEGFEEVYQLQGGVIGYGLHEDAEHWKGNLFVFDDRLVVPIGKEGNQPIGSCKHCQTAIDVYYNCANMDCNELFLSCPACAKAFQGCCCASCKEAPRVRPYQDEGRPKPFRKWSHEEKQALQRAASLPS